MFDQSHGLRFDIYERIHLSEELPGIAELEEVELLPEIQVIQREDRAELYGHLLLTGLYRSEDDRIQRLEHAIPVEINVPLTRVSSMEDIGVEIENFDIDLLTMRSVNITGVLSLRGIGGAEAVPVWQQEEYTVAYPPEEGGRTETSDVHEHENDALYENSLWTFGEGAVEEISEEHKAVGEALEKDKELNIHSVSNLAEEIEEPVNHYWPQAEPWSLVKTNLERKDTENLADTAVLNMQEESNASLTVAENIAPVAEDISPITENEQVSDLTFTKDVYAPVENASLPVEKMDLKIAMNSKKEPVAEENAPLTFSTLLNSSQSQKEKEDLHAMESAQSAQVTQPVEADSNKDSEWKSRFIGGSGGANLFRKVRLCIVQRADTLDTIAEKYQLSARELVMYNRLSGQNVEEGQVLYIP